MGDSLRYYAAACQTDLPNPRTREGIAGQVTHMLGMIDRAVVGYRTKFVNWLISALSSSEPTRPILRCDSKKSAKSGRPAWGCDTGRSHAGCGQSTTAPP